MRISILAVLLSIFILPACGGGDKDKEDTAGQPDAVAADVAAQPDGVSPDTSGNEETTVPTDSSDAAFVDSVPGEVLEQSGISAQTAQEFCEYRHCSTDECDEVAQGETCVEDCVAAILTDLAYYKKLICAKSAQDYCEGLKSCDGDYEIPELCVAACEDAAACGAVPGDMMGQNLLECHLACTSSTFESDGPIVECYAAAIKNCSGLEFMVCMEPEQPNPCDTWCAEDVAAECQVVPDPYATAEDCMAQCEGYTYGQTYAAMLCHEEGQGQMPVGCGEGVASCMLTPAELPDGALEYCEALDKKCGEVLELTHGLGEMGYDICAWETVGFRQTVPGFFGDFEAGKACVEALEFCPTGDMAGMYCLFQVPADGKAACHKAVDLCQSAETAANAIMECEVAMSFYAAFAEDFLPGIIDCTEAAEDCDAFGACFATGE